MHCKALEPLEAATISARTLAYYEHRAEEFRAGTQDHDVSQNIAALLRHIEGQPPFTILDFGCGPGRDLKTLAALGHTAIGLDGARPPLLPSRAPTPGATFGSRISLLLTFQVSAFTGFSRTHRYFMSRRKNCPACCDNCTPH